MEHAHVPQVLKSKDDLHQSINSPLHNDVKPNRTSTDLSHQQHVEPLRKVSRPSGGSDRSAEQSPLHRNQARASWERRNSSEGTHRTAPNTPGRLKSRFGGRGDESPEKGTAVPKFGEWDEGNPSSAEGFTQVFKQVREEKQTGSAKVPQIIDNSVPKNSYSQGGSYKSSSWCCFSWCKK